MFKNFLLIVAIIVQLSFLSLAKSDIDISVTIDEKIITNYDIMNEAGYLKILNPNLTQLENEKILEISKESLIREIIKKKEIEKIFNFSAENPLVEEYLKNLYTKLNFKNENEFNEFILKSSNYSLNDVKKKLKIEIAWNELIYYKYSNQLNINEEKLKEKINQLSNNKIKKYKLSEIVFKRKKDQNLENQINTIYRSISEIGFNNTANLYSISESSKFGGNVGWIKENNLSKLLLDSLKKISVGQHTEVNQIGNNFIILKIDELEETNIPINKSEELKKMIKFETNKQLNQFSRIFFDKSKMNYEINEK